MLRILPLRQTALHIVRTRYQPITRSLQHNAICLRQARSKSKPPVKSFLDLARVTPVKQQSAEWMERSKNEFSLV